MHTLGWEGEGSVDKCPPARGRALLLAQRGAGFADKGTVAGAGLARPRGKRLQQVTSGPVPPRGGRAPRRAAPGNGSPHFLPWLVPFPEWGQAVRARATRAFRLGRVSAARRPPPGPDAPRLIRGMTRPRPSPSLPPPRPGGAAGERRDSRGPGRGAGTTALRARRREPRAEEGTRDNAGGPDPGAPRGSGLRLRAAPAAFVLKTHVCAGARPPGGGATAGTAPGARRAPARPVPLPRGAGPPRPAASSRGVCARFAEATGHREWPRGRRGRPVESSGPRPSTSPRPRRPGLGPAPRWELVRRGEGGLRTGPARRRGPAGPGGRFRPGPALSGPRSRRLEWEPGKSAQLRGGALPRGALAAAAGRVF